MPAKRRSLESMRSENEELRQAAIAECKATIAPLDKEAVAIFNLNTPESLERFARDTVAPTGSDEDRSWLMMVTSILLLKTTKELYQNLIKKINRTLGGIGQYSEEKKRLFINNLGEGKKKIEDTTERCDKQIDNLLREICSAEDPAPESIRFRKEIIPFYLYHNKKYDHSQRTSRNLLMDNEMAPEDEMEKKALNLVDKRNGKYVRYVIKGQLLLGTERKPYVLFQKEPYHQCVVCQKDCTRLKHRCGSCKVTCYCSKECQTSDHPRHKEECEDLKLQAMAEHALQL